MAHIHGGIPVFIFLSHVLKLSIVANFIHRKTPLLSLWICHSNMNIKILSQLISEIFTHGPILRLYSPKNFIGDKVSHLMVEALVLVRILKFFRCLIVTMVILYNFTHRILLNVPGQKPLFFNGGFVNIKSGFMSHDVGDLEVFFTVFCEFWPILRHFFIQV